MRAFCPCHVTGFFALRDSAQGISSEGCGLVLSMGATTEATIGGHSVFLNGEPSAAPTTTTVVKLLSAEPMSVSTSLSLPTSCGFGTSGAGAFSAALAISGTLKLNRSLNALRDVAQRAEIICKTGVGDVVAQAIGGVVMRRRQGVDRILAPPVEISLIVFGEIPTAQIMTDRETMRDINMNGVQALKSLYKKPTFEAFMTLSKEFAYKSGLMGENVRDAIEAVEAQGGLASMAMLGDAVFAVDPAGALNEYRNVITTTIYHCGPHFIGRTRDEN